MVLEEHFERPEAERFVEDLFDEALALRAVEKCLFGVAQMLDDEADFTPQHVALQLANAIEVELIDQLVVDLPFQQVKFFGLGRVGASAGSGKRLHCRSIHRNKGKQ